MGQDSTGWKNPPAPSGLTERQIRFYDGLSWRDHSQLLGLVSSPAGRWHHSAGVRALQWVRTTALEYEPNLVFSQWVNGQAGGKANRTRIVIRNNSQRTEKGSINFMKGDRSPSTVNVAGVNDNQFNFEIPAWGTYERGTNGQGTLQTGVIEIYTESAAGR